MTTAPGSGSGSGTGAGLTPTVAPQTSGTRTVLSPIGLNVRSQPSATASILGSAAEGATLTVLGHSAGWYNVKGATVTGYITDDPTLSAAGTFMSYSDGQGAYSLLYPDGWTAIAAPPSAVVFHPATGHDSIVVSTAATIGQLGDDQLGYHQDSSTEVVVCGVTGQLVTYAQQGAAATATTAPVLPGTTVSEQNLVQINLTLDPTHALGVDANLSDLDQVPTVDDVINSLSFPFPQCQGGSTSTPGPATSVVTATTVF